MRRYGTHTPALRFGVEIQDATEWTRGSEFGVFANAPVVRYLVAPRAFSRAELGRLEEIAKEWGGKGLASPSHRRGARGAAFGAGYDRALRRRYRGCRDARARRSAIASRARARPCGHRAKRVPLD